MYTKIRNVQYIISMMKAYGVKNIVLSAGTRHVAIAESVENDSFFNCYSVVDERSAGYFAIGLAKELNEPVAIACTSSTATCNYYPAVAEAYYQSIPLLILTGDRNPYLLDQMEDQMIDQVGMYSNVCKRCASLPIVRTDEDAWYCQRLLNEAMAELRYGPVHINFPVIQTVREMTDTSEVQLPSVRKIEHIKAGDNNWKDYVEKLKNYKKILIIGGLCSEIEAMKIGPALSAFAKKYPCAIAAEQTSNCMVPKAYKFNPSFTLTMTDDAFDEAAPDLVITFGGNFINGLKEILRRRPFSCDNWLIDSRDRVCDSLKNLSVVFCCEPAYFFENMLGIQNSQNDMKYIEQWKKIENSITPIQAPWSSYHVIEKLAKSMPENTLVHLGILNSTRIMGLFDLPESVSVYSNLGTDGIDGSMSTFFGQMAVSKKKLGILVLGDLSFFYDMNSVGINCIDSRCRILLLNNGGAAEFHFTMGRDKLPNIDLHIAAAHQKTAEDWVKACGFQYLQATDASSYEIALKRFLDPNHKGPVFLEIFTDKEVDAKILHEHYDNNVVFSSVERSKSKIKSVLSKLRGK